MMVLDKQLVYIGSSMALVNNYHFLRFYFVQNDNCERTKNYEIINISCPSLHHFHLLFSLSVGAGVLDQSSDP